jgi:hypothetical protein
MPWVTAIEVVEDNVPGAERNRSGLGIFLTNAEQELRREITRIGFDRKNTSNPDTPFEEVFQAEFEKALHAVDILDSVDDQLERIQAQVLEEARDRLDELLGPEPAVPPLA